MEQKKGSSQKPKEHGKNTLIVVLIILVIISGIKLYTDHVEKSKKSEEIIILSSETNELNNRLDSVVYQLDLRIQEIEQMGGTIDNLKEIREGLIEERQSDQVRTEADINLLNKQLDSYIALLKEKDQEVLELRQANEVLHEENVELKSSQAEIEEEVVQLEIKQQELQEVVTAAAKLVATNISIAAVNSRGRERENEFRNRHIDKLKISFQFADNPITAHGLKDVFVQVIAPNSQPIFDLAKGSGTFQIDGREEFYTSKQDLLFDNTQQQLTFFYEKGSDYAAGTYDVRIYTEGFLIGEKNFEVK